MAKEEVILDLSVDQGSMIQELERTKKSIIQLKQEQQELTKAYKAGNVTVEEYASESVRLESILKKQQATYNNTQKSVTGVKTKMDELIGSNNKLADSVSKSTENIRVGGVSVAELGTKITALANPVTAAVAVVGALGAAYARSTIGAKDLEFASNQLSAATTILTNNFASLISSAEDGEGAFTSLLNNVLNALGPAGIALAQQSKAIALAGEQIDELQRQEISIRSQISDRLTDNQELLTKIQDSQTSYNEKIDLTSEIVGNITKNEDELLAVKNEQLKFAQAKLNADKENDDLQRAVLEVEREIANISKDAERRRQGIFRLESNIKDAEQKRLDTLKKQTEETQKKIKIQEDADRKEFESREVSFDDDPSKGKEFDPQEQFEKDKEIIDAELGLVLTAEEKKQAAALKTNATKEQIHQEDKKRLAEEIQMLEDNFNALAGLFSQGSEARKLFALAGIGADTASAIASLTAMSEANPANAFTFGGAGIAQYAAGIIRILANIVAAKEFLGGSFAGGADFVTSKPTMIMVGDNPGNRERVTVQPLSGRGKSTYNKKAGLASFAGGGSMTFDPASATASANVNQALATSNAIKRMPRPVVGVKEIARVMNSVEVKQNVSKQ